MLTRPLVPGAPDDPAARIRLGRIAVTPAEMKQIFDVVHDSDAHLLTLKVQATSPVAAVNISGPSSRWTIAELRSKFSSVLMETARACSSGTAVRLRA